MPLTHCDMDRTRDISGRRTAAIWPALVSAPAFISVLVAACSPVLHVEVLNATEDQVTIYKSIHRHGADKEVSMTLGAGRAKRFPYGYLLPGDTLRVSSGSCEYTYAVPISSAGPWSGWNVLVRLEPDFSARVVVPQYDPNKAYGTMPDPAEERVRLERLRRIGVYEALGVTIHPNAKTCHDPSAD